MSLLIMCKVKIIPSHNFSLLNSNSGINPVKINAAF